MWFREHRRNLKDSLQEKSKLVQHAYEEDYRTGWNEVRILEIEVTAGIGNRRNQPI
jgi:hypothetical protein